MIQGDRNTSFYHLSTLTRRKRNHIASVKDDMGEWITSEREVIEFFQRGFISLYSTSHVAASWVPFQHPLSGMAECQKRWNALLVPWWQLRKLKVCFSPWNPTKPQAQMGSTRVFSKDFGLLQEIQLKGKWRGLSLVQEFRITSTRPSLLFFRRYKVRKP